MIFLELFWTFFTIGAFTFEDLLAKLQKEIDSKEM